MNIDTLDLIIIVVYLVGILLIGIGLFMIFQAAGRWV